MRKIYFILVSLFFITTLLDAQGHNDEAPQKEENTKTFNKEKHLHFRFTIRGFFAHYTGEEEKVNDTEMGNYWMV